MERQEISRAGLGIVALGAMLADIVTPAGVSRLDLEVRNPKLAKLSRKLPPQKSRTLLRRIAETVRKDAITQQDVNPIMAAAKKRERRLARNLKIAQAGGAALMAEPDVELPKIVGGVA